MRKLVLVLIVILGCKQYEPKDYLYNNSVVKNVMEKMSGKDSLNDSLIFNSFQEYCNVIPDIKLPYDNNSKVDSIPFDLQSYLQKSNYGIPYGSPVAKLVQEKFVGIIFIEPVDAVELNIYTYNFNGEIIDTIPYIGYGPNYDQGYQEHCYAIIDKDLNITRIDSTIMSTIDSVGTKIKGSDSIVINKSIYTISKSGKYKK